MPRIPIIEQTTNVAMSTPTTQAHGSQVLSPLGNAPAIAASGLDDISRAGMYQQHALLQKENADAVANTGKPLADADVYWKDFSIKAAQSTTDGGLIKQEDGSTIGLKAHTEAEFDKWQKGFLEPITNEKAKAYATDHINRLREQTLTSALVSEAHAGIANRSDKVDKAVTTWAASVAQDDSDIKQKILAAKTLVANSGFDEATRNQRATLAVQMIVEAAIHGNIERNPQATRAALIARYGIDPTAPPPATAPDDGQASVVTRNADGTVSLNTDPNLPAGMRNNNPGNIVYANQKDALGPSVNRDNGGKSAQAVYATPEDGMSAMFQLALRKYGSGKTTADSLIAGQGGFTAGNHAAAANVAKIMGIDPNADLNLLDPDMLKRFGRALMLQEHGPASQKYSDDMVSRVAENVIAGRTSTPSAAPGSGSINQPVVAGTADANSTPHTPAYSPAMAELVGQLPVEKLPSYISAATTRVNQQQALVKSQLSTTEGDHITAFMNGDTVAKPLNRADYERAYGPLEGAERFANYQSVQTLGSDITSMKAMPPEQMANLAARYKPNADSPGYELATKRYETILKAVDLINTARQADPMAYAMGAKIGGAQPMNFQDPKDFAAELSKRQGVAATMQSTYGAPFSLLTQAEAKTLHAGFDGMTTQQRLGYLDTIRKSVSDPFAYRSIMGQIAPDSPVTAMAGIIMQKQSPNVTTHMFSADAVYRPQDVAGIMLEGEALINPSKAAKGEDGKGKAFPMPKEQDIRDQFNNTVGTAFANDPRGADFAYQAVKAYYAGRAARVGDVSGNTNSGVLKEAIDAVIGGVSDGGTGKNEVVRPWGMSQDAFKDNVQRSFTAAMAANGYTGNAANLRNYSLASAGDGKYLLQNGGGTMFGTDNKPIVLDLNAMPSGQTVISPSEVNGVVKPAPTVVPEKSVKPTTQKPKTK